VLKHEVDGTCTVSVMDMHSAGSHQPCDWLRTTYLLQSVEPPFLLATLVYDFILADTGREFGREHMVSAEL